MNSLKKQYNEQIVPELIKKHNYTTVMAVPKLEKIVVNMGTISLVYFSFKLFIVTLLPGLV